MKEPAWVNRDKQDHTLDETDPPAESDDLLREIFGEDFADEDVQEAQQRAQEARQRAYDEQVKEADEYLAECKRNRPVKTPGPIIEEVQ